MGSFVQTLLSFAPSLTITTLNLVLPLLFTSLSNFEDWSPSFEVSINLFRYVMVLFSWYLQRNIRCGGMVD